MRVNVKYFVFESRKFICKMVTRCRWVRKNELAEWKWCQSLMKWLGNQGSIRKSVWLIDPVYWRVVLFCWITWLGRQSRFVWGWVSLLGFIWRFTKSPDTFLENLMEEVQFKPSKLWGMKQLCNNNKPICSKQAISDSSIIYVALFLGNSVTTYATFGCVMAMGRCTLHFWSCNVGWQFFFFF